MDYIFAFRDNLRWHLSLLFSFVSSAIAAKFRVWNSFGHFILPRRPLWKAFLFKFACLTSFDTWLSERVLHDIIVEFVFVILFKSITQQFIVTNAMLGYGLLVGVKEILASSIVNGLLIILEGVWGMLVAIFSVIKLLSQKLKVLCDEWLVEWVYAYRFRLQIANILFLLLHIVS